MIKQLNTPEDYNFVVDNLNSSILNKYGKKWCGIELTRYYNGDKEDIVLINFLDYGQDISIRLYHNQLDEDCKTKEDILLRCIETLQDTRDGLLKTFNEIISLSLY